MIRPRTRYAPKQYTSYSRPRTMKVSSFALLLLFLLSPHQCESYTEVFSIARDSNDNTYLVGNRDANFFISKKSASCTLQWESTAGSTSGDDDNDFNAEVLYDVTVGQDDVVYAVGSTKGNFSSPLDKVPNLDAAVLVYDPRNGDVVIQKQYDIVADLDNIAQAITQKADGNLLIAVHGSVSNIETSVTYQTRILDIDSRTLDVQRIHEIEVTTTEGFFSLTGGPKIQALVYEESSDSITALGHILGKCILWKYNLTTNTTTSQTEWGDVLGNFQISEFTTDGNGAYFVVGSSSERVLGNDDLLSTVSSEFHAYVIRYDNLESSPSSATWVRQLAGSGSSQSGRGIAIDPVTGDIVVVGDFDADFTVTDGQTSESFTVDSFADNGITDVFLWILNAGTGDFKDLRSSSVASTASEDRGNTVSVLSTRTILIGGVTDDGSDAGATVCDTGNVLPSASASFSPTASITSSRTALAVATASEQFLQSAITTPTASLTASPSIGPVLSETPKLLSHVPSFLSAPTASSAQSIVGTTIPDSLNGILPSSFETSVSPSILVHSNIFSGIFEVFPTPFERPSNIFEVTASSSPASSTSYEVLPTPKDFFLMMETAEVQLPEAANASNLYAEVSESPIGTAFASDESETPSSPLRHLPTAFFFSPIPPISSQDVANDGEITSTFSTTPEEVISTLIPSISVSLILIDFGMATPSTPTLMPSQSLSFTLVDLGTATPSSSSSPLERVPNILSPEDISFSFDFPIESWESTLESPPFPASSEDEINFVSPIPLTGLSSVLPKFGAVSTDFNPDASNFPTSIGEDEIMSKKEPDDARGLASTSILGPSDIIGGNDITMIFGTPDASGTHSVAPEQIMLAFGATIEPSSVLLDSFANTTDGIQESSSSQELLESSFNASGEIPLTKEPQPPFSMYPFETMILQTPQIFQVTEFWTPIETAISTEADPIGGPAFSKKFSRETMSREPNEMYTFYVMPSLGSRATLDIPVSPEGSHGPMGAEITSPFPILNAYETAPVLVPSKFPAETDQEPSASALFSLKDFVSSSSSPIITGSISKEISPSEIPSISPLLQTTSSDAMSPPLNPKESGEVIDFVKLGLQSMLLPSEAYEEEILVENTGTETPMDEEGMLKAAPSVLQTPDQDQNIDFLILQSYEPEVTHLSSLEASRITSSVVYSNEFDGKENVSQTSVSSEGGQFIDGIHDQEKLDPEASANIFEMLPGTSTSITDEKEDFDNPLTPSSERTIEDLVDAIEIQGSPSSSEGDQPQTKASNSPLQIATISSSVGPQPSETAAVKPTIFLMPTLSFELSGPTLESFAFSSQSNEVDLKQSIPTLLEGASDGSVFPSEVISLIPLESALGGSIEQSTEHIPIFTSEILPSLPLISSALDFKEEYFTIEPGDGTEGGVEPTSEDLFVIPSLTASPFYILGSPTGFPGEIGERSSFTFSFTNQPFSTPVAYENSGEDSTNLDGSQMIRPTPSTTESALFSMSAPPTFITLRASKSASSSISPTGFQEVPREPLTSFIDIVFASATPSASPISSQGISSATPAISAVSVSPTTSGVFITITPLVSKETIHASPSVGRATMTPNQSARSGPSDTVSIILPSATPSSSSAMESNNPETSSTNDVPLSSSSMHVSTSSFPSTASDTSAHLSPAIAPSISVQLNTPTALPSATEDDVLPSSSFSQVAASSEVIMTPSPAMSNEGKFSITASVSALSSMSILTSLRPSSPTFSTNPQSFSPQPSSSGRSTPIPTKTLGTSPMLTTSVLPSVCPKPISSESPKFLPSISSQPSSLATSTATAANTPRSSPLVTHSFLPSFCPEPTSPGPSAVLPSISSQPSSLATSTATAANTPGSSPSVIHSFAGAFYLGQTSLEPSDFPSPFSSELLSLETPIYLSPTFSVFEEGQASVSPFIIPYTSKDFDDASASFLAFPSSSGEFDPSMSLFIFPYTSENFDDASTSLLAFPSPSGEFDPSMPSILNPSVSEDVAASRFPSMIPVPSRIEFPTLEPTESSTAAISSPSSSSSTILPTADCMKIETTSTDLNPLNKTRNFQRVNMVIQVAGPKLTSSCQFTAVIAERFIFLSAINTLSQADMWHITSVEDGPPVHMESSSLVLIEQGDNVQNGIAGVSPTPSKSSGKREIFTGSAIFNVTAFMDSLSVALASGPYVEYIDSQNIVQVMTAEGFNDIKWTGMVVGPVIVDGRSLEEETRTARGSLSSGEISALAMGALLIVGLAIFVIVEGGVLTRRPGPMLPI